MNRFSDSVRQRIETRNKFYSLLGSTIFAASSIPRVFFFSTALTEPPSRTAHSWKACHDTDSSLRCCVVQWSMRCLVRIPSPPSRDWTRHANAWGAKPTTLGRSGQPAFEWMFLRMSAPPSTGFPSGHSVVRYVGMPRPTKLRPRNSYLSSMPPSLALVPTYS